MTWNSENAYPANTGWKTKWCLAGGCSSTTSQSRFKTHIAYLENFITLRPKPGVVSADLSAVGFLATTSRAPVDWRLYNSNAEDSIMPAACQTKLILWPGSKAPLAISCYSSKGSGSVARWEPTGLCFALTRKVHYQSSEDIMVIFCHHPHGLGLQGDGKEKRHESSGVGGHLSRHGAAHKDVDETRQNMNWAVFACCWKGGRLSLDLNALQWLRLCDVISAKSGSVNQEELC